jgi:hypothetical protein
VPGHEVSQRARDAAPWAIQARPSMKQANRINRKPLGRKASEGDRKRSQSPGGKQ